jgi:hypothetical protein
LSSWFGFILGLVGGLLDFVSGTGLLQNGMQQTMMESATDAQNQGVGLGLYVLGAIVIASAVALVTSVGRGHSKLLSGLMVVNGVVMLLVGGWMAGDLPRMMTSAPTYGYAMVVVGALMIANGSMMSRNKMKM